MAIVGRQAVGQIGVTLIVRDVAAAADFYRDVFGAEEVERSFRLAPTDAPGDEATAAELRLSGAYLIVAKENPRWREAPRPDWPRSPASAGATSVGVTLYVDDVDEVFARAVAAGVRALGGTGTVEATFWGDRHIQFHDPFGHLWRVMTRIEDVEATELPARFAAERAAHRRARGLA
ncbi:VOC family protein [Roseomonas sp. HJA6]|uniref:VOC family protein n=1 Tax=Roseomonas alba TaxID=2846776 RepID=A0ABS7ABW0_9PROT|nr:VOC family protein [Neoroseomonas alba]MBW6399787.1 VOC family protein [Neoroseomonas alba]